MREMKKHEKSFRRTSTFSTAKSTNFALHYFSDLFTAFCNLARRGIHTGTHVFVLCTTASFLQFMSLSLRSFVVGLEKHIFWKDLDITAGYVAGKSGSISAGLKAFHIGVGLACSVCHSRNCFPASQYFAAGSLTACHQCYYTR